MSFYLLLCRRFLKGHNFLPWFRRKRAVAEQEQYKLWRQASINTNIQRLISKMSELEIVDSFNAIERQLLGEMQASAFSKFNSTLLVLILGFSNLMYTKVCLMILFYSDKKVSRTRWMMHIEWIILTVISSSRSMHALKLSSPQRLGKWGIVFSPFIFQAWESIFTH